MTTLLVALAVTFVLTGIFSYFVFQPWDFVEWMMFVLAWFGTWGGTMAIFANFMILWGSGK